MRSTFFVAAQRYLFFLADLIANDRASRSASDGSQRAAKNCIACNATDHSACASSNLCIGWACAATS